MAKKDLKQTFKEIKEQIKANSNDPVLADKLIKNLLVTKKKIDDEPTIVCLKEKDIYKTLKGDTFEMNVMKDGFVNYHVYGGYTVVCSPKFKGLNETIRDYVYNQDLAQRLNKEEKEAYDLDLSATGYVLGIPMYAFSDPDFKFKIATEAVKFLREQTDRYKNQQLQPETTELDQKFEEAAIGMETIKQQIDEDVKNINLHGNES